MNASAVRTVAAVTAICLLVTGCTMGLPRPGSAAPPPSGDRAPADTAEPAVPASAGMLLLEQARAERSAGRLDAATSSVERALRIEPNEPLLWIELGEINAQQGDRTQADLMARKALSLAGGNASIEARALALIE